MRAEFISKSLILEPGKLEEKLAATVSRSLKELKQAIRDHQVYGPHTGLIYNTSKRIDGGVIRHQASRKGESPAPLSGKLLNSAVIEQTAHNRGEIVITAPYGEILVDKLDRDIVETPEKEYAPKFDENIAAAVRELL